ncbi:hypothetical protein AJ79_06027 [Helicocarpus griseus UAMH5409]|uniref:C2H2-type domain-containing protein n=1 Tax=Helicocarpus griseus UAMH5409 TaxID=1447875 RepID=A0A2B7XHE9_9EURO|nr:hypothetical protein AJ79_06027 [Helicocarpus griseus UAMH5409]
MAQDDDFHPQDAFSFSPFCGSSNLPDISQWTYMSSSSSTTSETTDESFETSSMPVTESDVSSSQGFTFTSYSHPVLPGHLSSLDNNANYTSLSDIHNMQDTTGSGNSPHLAFSSPQGYQPSLSSVFVLPFENDGSQSNGAHGCDQEDTKQIRLGSQEMDDAELFTGPRAFHNLPMDTDGFSVGTTNQASDLFGHAPITPPLTDGSNDASISSACSQASYPSFSGHEDTLFADVSHSFSLGDPLYRLTPPSEQDPNRASKQSQRPLLSAASSRPRKTEQDLYTLSVGQSQGYNDSQDARSPRDHPFYSVPTQADGKYHCPFENDEKPCNHSPTTQKCAYHKYLDSHLKPYRCKVSQCVDAHFSSNACLFRHEREAHGMHGHGENPHLCHFPTCERSVPGNGFPRRWNLHDHMKRVHDYTSFERVSSPEQSPVVGQQSKKKDSAARKRKGTKATTMKRVRSSPPQTMSSAKVAQTQAQQGQQLQNAERNYYNCLARLQEDLKNINPQDPALHDKANASLQELHTLGLNYRCIRASQAANERSSAYSR